MYDFFSPILYIKTFIFVDLSIFFLRVFVEKNALNSNKSISRSESTFCIAWSGFTYSCLQSDKFEVQSDNLNYS